MPIALLPLQYVRPPEVPTTIPPTPGLGSSRVPSYFGEWLLNREVRRAGVCIVGLESALTGLSRTLWIIGG